MHQLSGHETCVHNFLYTEDDARDNDDDTDPATRVS